MIVGTAGHIDHGKTSLVRALTGVDTDRLKEEKARGISIDLGFAYLPAPGATMLGFVDVPGHEKFVHNMLAGATGIDFVLLVIAADDGVMPQTREHLAIVDLLGIRHGIVALTKTDLVATDDLVAVSAEIAATLAPTALAGADILLLSTVTGAGVDALRTRLFDEAQALGPRAARGRFRLAVDRCFTLTGAGTIVTGTVLSGSVAVGDRVTVSPSGLTARVRSIHAQNRPAGRGSAGERCALNLVGDGITKDAIARGDVLLDPGLHAPTDRIDATLTLLASEAKPVTTWMPARLHHAATEIGARVVLLGESPIRPGDTAPVQLVLEHPIAAASGDRFVLRDTSAQRTIGGGALLDLRAPSRRRRTAARLAQIQAHGRADHAQALTALLNAPPYHLDLAAFGRDRALADAELAALIEALGLVCPAAPVLAPVFAAERWRILQDDFAAALRAFHAANADLPGIGADKLRVTQEPRLPKSAFQAVLQALAKSGALALDGAWVRLPQHSVALAPADEKTWSRIKPLITGAERFRPPRTRDLADVTGRPETDIRRLMKLLARMGQVDEVAPDHFFTRATVAEMVAIASDAAVKTTDHQFTAAQFRDRLDNGRKVAIQILEFFDRHGVTIRRGDLRRMNPQRLEAFGKPPEANAAAAPRQASSGRETSPVGRPDFKSGRGRKPVFGGFDSHSLPPSPRRSR